MSDGKIDIELIVVVVLALGDDGIVCDASVLSSSCKINIVDPLGKQCQSRFVVHVYRKDSPYLHMART